MPMMHLPQVAPSHHLVGWPVGRTPVVALIAGTSALLTLCAPSTGRAQSFTPYAVFQSMTQTELATLQIKLTWLGFQTRSTTTAILTAQGHAPDVALFTPFQRPGFDYGNDAAQIDSVAATVQELDALLDSVAALPGVTDGGVDTGGLLSFALLNTAGGTRAFESILDTTNAAAVFPQMLNALGGNSVASRRLRELACTLNLVDGAPPSEVTSSVVFSLRGFRLVRSTGEMVGVVKVTNLTGTTLVAPLTLVVIGADNLELTGESGRTCRIDPAGLPFIDLAVGGGLGAGATVEQVLRFRNPDLDAVAPELHLYSGSGAR